MRIDASMVHYLLSREFRDVEAFNVRRSLMVDYPMLYDISSDMGGHVILVPEHERPHAGLSMSGSLCVCMGAGSARAAVGAGFAVLQVSGMTFQRLYNYMQAMFVRMERLDAQLRAYVDTNAGFQSLIEASVRATGCPCALVDEEYRMVCQYPHRVGGGDGEGVPHEGDMFESDVIDLFMASRGYRHMRRSHHVFTIPGTTDLFMKNLFCGSQLVGTLVFRHEGDVLSARYVRSLLGYLGGFVEEMFARVGTFGLPSLGSSRVRSALRSLVSGGSASAEDIRSLLVENGHVEPSCYAVLRVVRSFTNEADAELNYLVRRIELQWPFSYCIVLDEALFVLVDLGAGARTGRDYLDELPAAARDSLVKVGVSREFADVGDIGVAWAQAKVAYEYGNSADPTFWCYRFDDYALDWMLSWGRGGHAPESVCHPGLAALARYDEGHGSELVKTLDMYLRCRFNASETSKRLFIARSTLLHRLDRIHELTRIDLDDFEDRVYLEISLLILAG